MGPQYGIVQRKGDEKLSLILDLPMYINLPHCQFPYTN